MHRPSSRAFTLIELLVVIAIIAVLAGVALPVFGSVQATARKTQSLSNMRQLGAGLLSYCNDNNSALPLQGDSAPTWTGAASTTSATEATAWYNAVPREMQSQGVGDYQNNRAMFYTKGSLFYIPAAKYPTTKLNQPVFAISFNSKLFTSAVVSLRLSNITYPAKTCIFQESGLLGETPIYAKQSSYNGQAATFASRSVARYSGQTVLVFADGHAGEFSGKDIVDATTGKAYFPQSLGKVYWTVDPTANANS